MDFHQLLLLIIHKFQGERSSTAPYYLLKGKKSGQTMQDVTYFQLHSFFSVYPKLSMEEYNSELSILLMNECIEMKDSYILLTDKGLVEIQSMKQPLLNGWLYRGNELVFWHRLELVVQTLSYYQANEKKFIPNQKNSMIHQFVKKYLVERNFQTNTFQSNFKNQLLQLLESSLFEDIHRELFVYRLSGYRKSGLTWEQLARLYNKKILDIKLLFIESLHMALSLISYEKYPDLFALAKDVEVAIPLTESARKTYQLFRKGYKIDEIAKMRYLKLNTIEDHVIEIVSANHDFPVQSFITNEQLQKVQHISRKLQTKKLKIIRDQVSDVSYFQIRIALAKGEEVNG